MVGINVFELERRNFRSISGTLSTCSAMVGIGLMLSAALGPKIGSQDTRSRAGTLMAKGTMSSPERSRCQWVAWLKPLRSSNGDDHHQTALNHGTAFSAVMSVTGSTVACPIMATNAG